MSEFFEKIYLECECDSMEHTMVLQFDPSDGTVYVNVNLNQYRSWWQRAWVAVKYAFGYESKYGHWDCTMLSPKQLGKFQDVIERAIVAQKAYNDAERQKYVK